MMSSSLIVGIGSYNGDDQAGWLALERLQNLGFPAAFLKPIGHPAKLLDMMCPDQPLVICDACIGAGHVGHIRSFGWPSEAVTYRRGSGSHDLSLNEILELAKQMSCSPGSITIWTIEGGQWVAGSAPASAVRSAADRVGDMIWESCRHA